MLQALVRRERVLRAVPPVAELAHVERVGLLVLVLEVPLERVVAAEGAPAVGALLGLVDASRRRRRHSHRACNSQGTDRARGGAPAPAAAACRLASGSTTHYYTDSGSTSGVGAWLVVCTWEGGGGGVGGRTAAQRGVGVLKELNVDVPLPLLVVCIDVRHQRVPGAVHALADDAAVLFLPLGVLVGDVPLQGRL